MAIGTGAGLPKDNRAKLPNLGQGFQGGGIRRPKLMSLYDSEGNKGANEAKRSFNRGAVSWKAPRRSRRARFA